MRLLYILICCLLLSGCGLFKSVHREKQSSSTETERNLKKDSTSVKIDKSVTTVRELADTTIVVPERTETQETFLNRDSLISGMTAIKSDLVDVKLILDPLTGVLTTLATIKKQYLHVAVNKTTTTKNDIRTDVKTNEQKSDKSKVKQSSSTVKKDPVKMGVWLAAFALILVVFFVIRIIRKR